MSVIDSEKVSNTFKILKKEKKKCKFLSNQFGEKKKKTVENLKTQFPQLLPMVEKHFSELFVYICILCMNMHICTACGANIYFTWEMNNADDNFFSAISANI